MRGSKRNAKPITGKFCRAALVVAIATCLPVFAAAAQLVVSEATSSYNIPAGDLPGALDKFSTQSGIQLLYRPELVVGKRARAVTGALTPTAALRQLLEGTGVAFERVNDSTYALKSPPLKLKPKEKQKSAAATAPVKLDPAAENPVTLPEILVKGSKSLNTDMLRSEDDIQPYVVFEREEIEQSFATNIEEFLITRLPMNASRGTESRNSAGTRKGNQSSFDLRGLGSNQTLILINGRRAPGIQSDRGADLSQPDLNGIPIAAIERIEILPTTASGIFGGGATGGVINIILRKDYQGSEVQVSYDNSFDTDSSKRRIDASSGFSLEGGRTQVMLAASYSDANDLQTGDREFSSRARAAALANDPGGLESNMPAGNRTNYRSVDGYNLTLTDGTSLGTTFGSVPIGYLGGDGGLGLVDGAGVYDMSIPQGITGARQSLVAAPTTSAANITIRREMSSAISAYLDASITRNASLISYAGTSTQYLLFPGDPGNPFENIVSFAIPAGDYEASTSSESETKRVLGGITVEFSPEWTGGLEVNWNRSSTKHIATYGVYDKSAVEGAFAAGTLNPFRDTGLFPLDLSPYELPAVTDFGPSVVGMTEFAARIAGPAFMLPAGPVSLSGLASFRREVAESTIEPAGSAYSYYPERHQDVSSVYFEATAPVVDQSQAVSGVNSLELQASVRWDKYRTVSVPTGQSLRLPTIDSPLPDVDYQKTNFDSVDYTVGLRYRPIEDVTVRASYATGFLSPSLAQIASLVIENGYGYVRDPKRGGMRTFFPSRMVLAGNPGVQPESSESLSAGIIYAPSFLQGLRLSIDYTRIKKRDEITTLTQQNIVDLEDDFPGRVVRGPVGPLDPPGYAGPITSIDTSVLNVAASRVEAYDFQVDYDWNMGDKGNLRLYAIATLQTALERQVLPTSPIIDRVGFSDGPLERRGNVGFVWAVGAYSFAANTQFYDRYKVYSSTFPLAYLEFVTRPQGGEYVQAQSYTDVSARYVFENGPLTGTQVSLGVRNIFDQSPPVVAGWSSTGGYSTFGDPRMRTYAVTIKKAF